VSSGSVSSIIMTSYGSATLAFPAPECNDPEKSPLLELLVISFSRHLDVMHHIHASIILHIFVKLKIILTKLYFNFSPMVL
jgi:hypothetical protein